MDLRSLKRRWGGASTARRRAAAIALDEGFTAKVPQPGADDVGELGAELASMRALVQTLEHLPGQAWASELGPAPALKTSITRSGALAESSSASRRPTTRGRQGRTRIAPRVGGPLAAGALVAAFFVGAVTQPFAAGVSPSRVAPLAATAHVVLKPLPGTASTSLAVAYMPGGGHMVLNIRNLPRSAPGSYYELWLMTSDTDLVSVSSFRVGAAGNGSLQLVLPDDPKHYKYLDISVQHVGGVPAISQDNVLRGAIPA